MNKIDQLLQQYSPDGVEMVKLISVADVLYGCPFDATLFTEDDSYIPLIRIRDILPGTPSTYLMGDYDSKYIIHKGDILVGMDGNFNLAKWNSRDGVLCQRSCKISAKEGKSIDGYLFHLLKPLFKQIEDNTPGGSVKHLSAKAINAIEIPLPPLPVQEEIVRILDAMSGLVDNLDEEIKSRKKQYEHYREELLTFGEEVEKIELSQLFTLRGGYTPTTSNSEFWTEEGGLPWFKMEDIRDKGRLLEESYNHITEKAVKGKGLFPAGTLVFATSATIGEHAMLLVPALTNQRFTALIKKDERTNMKFFFYYGYIIDKWCKTHTIQGNFAGVDMDGFKRLPVPLPPLSVQQEIVEKLDAFEALIQNLEAERDLRQKQYEYYREKLLTF